MKLFRALLILSTLSATLAAEEPTTDKPAPEILPVAAPWSFKEPLTFDIVQTESSESKLGSKRIDYKDRGSSEARIRASLASVSGDTPKIVLNASAFTGFVRNWEGQRWDYSLDKASFTEMRSDKIVRQVKLSGKAEDHTALKTAFSTPWAELTWKDSTSSSAALTAQGLAQPLAEIASLDRQLEILLPPMPGEALFEGSVFHQDVAIPLSVPLKGAARIKLSYRVVSIEAHRYLSITFDGENSEKVQDGFEWGGIAMPEVSVNVKIRGKLTRDTHHQMMTGGELEYEVELVSKRFSFKSKVTGKTEWKRKE
jgi:hypothetical protein